MDEEGAVRLRAVEEDLGVCIARSMKPRGEEGRASKGKGWEEVIEVTGSACAGYRSHAWLTKRWYRGEVTTRQRECVG